MKKILGSVGMLALVGVLVWGATGAFFSDTETSTGNTFTAGAIDLKIDNESYVTNNDGVLVASPDTSWAMSDLTDQLFFNFTDLKPGDVGEDTISLHVTDNPAYACAVLTLTKDDDMSSNEPELSSPDVQDDPNDLFDGELASRLNFVWWADDGDNVLEEDEAAGVNAGKGVMGNLDWMMNEEGPYYGDQPNEMLLTLADSQWNFFTGSDSGPIDGSKDYFIAKAWCLGELTMTPVAQDGQGKTGQNGPLSLRGTGVSCDGSTEGNITQTDAVMADVEFYAVQARNNENFLCEEHQRPQTPTIVWVETTQTGGDASIVDEPGRGNVLSLVTIADNSSRVRWTNSTLNLDLDVFTGVSYDSKQVSANDLVNGNATMRLTIDLDGDTNTADTQEITYEPYYNILAHNPLNDASILGNTWQTWNTTMANGKFWGNGGFLGTTPSGGAYATNITLSQVVAAYPNAKIVGISLGMGTWNQNQVVLVDNLIINGSPVSLEN